VFLELEGLGDQACFVGALDVVEVLHRRRDVGVPRPLLDPADVRLRDHPRAERVAQVVKAQRTQIGAFERRSVPARKGRGIEVVAERARKDELVFAGEVLALAESGECLGYCRREWDGTDFAALGCGETAAGEGAADADAMCGEVDVAPAEGDEFASAQSGERRGEVDRGVLFGIGYADEREDLFRREDLDGG
jgi:hypothetical protein